MDRCIYASLIGVLVGFLMSCMSSSKGRIKSLLKREKNNVENFRKEAIIIVNSLRRKTLIFIIVNFICICLFWYYVSAFCYCYSNSSIDWLIGGFVTWGFTLILPFIICLLTSVFRYIGLKYNIEASYKISACLSD